MGARVAILRVPNSRAEEWVEVQYAVDGNRSTVGYIPSYALGNWSSDNPDLD
jgi:hypothetical protein